MTYRRGDVILAWVPFTNRTVAKRRPVLVVQSDSLASEFINDQIVIVPISSNMSRSGYPCRVEIMTGSSEFAGSSLRGDSVIMADKVITLDVGDIDKKIGSIGNMSRIDAALRVVFDL